MPIQSGSKTGKPIITHDDKILPFISQSGQLILDPKKTKILGVSSISGSIDLRMQMPGIMEKFERDRIRKELLKRKELFDIKLQGPVQSRGGTTRVGLNDYTIVEIDNQGMHFVLLESIGELGNATYIAKINPDNPISGQEISSIADLEMALIALGRVDIKKLGIVHSIIHEESKYKSYNYSSNHLLNIIDYLLSCPDEFWKIIQRNKECKLSTIVKSLPNSTNALFSIVQKVASQYDISKDDVFASVSNLTGIAKIPDILKEEK